MRKSFSKKIGRPTWGYLAFAVFVAFAVGLVTGYLFVELPSDSLRTAEDVQIQQGDLILIHNSEGEKYEVIEVDELLDVRIGTTSLADIHITRDSADFLAESEQASQ